MPAGTGLSEQDKTHIRAAFCNPTVGANMVSFMDAIDTLTRTEMNYIDAITAIGTAQASKALVVDTNIALTGMGALTINAGVDSYFAQGTFHSTTAGSGIALATAVTAASRFYSDDGGAAIVNTGVNDTRGVLSRLLATTDHSANELRLFALEGQLKAYNATWDNEMCAGVYGYLEFVNTGSTTFDGYGFTAGVMSCVENSGAMVIGTNHVLSGFCAVSKITSDLTATGKTAAFHAAIYDGTNWSSSGEDETAWEYGLYVGSASVAGIEIADGPADGLLISGACTDGIEISGDSTNAINISAGCTPTVGLLIAGAAATGISITGVCTSLGISLSSQTAELITGLSTITLSSAHRNAVSITAISPANAAYQLRGIYALVYPSTAEQATTRLVGVHSEIQTLLNTYSVMPIYGYINCAAAKSIAAESAAVMGDINVDNAIGMTGRLAAVHAKVRGDSAVTGSLDCVHADAEMSVDTVIYCNVDTSMTATVGLSLAGAGTYTVGIDTGDQCTTGIDIGTSTTGISVTGTVTTGIDFTGATIAPDASRTNSAIAIGDRLGAKTITMASGTKHLDPVQINLLIAGTNPTAGSTVNGIYQLITHSTAMASVRLKCADWNIAVSANLQDAYAYQGEVLFSGSGVTVGGEAAVLGLVMNAGASAVTGNLRGLIISMQGAGFPADGIGIELRSTATTLAEGIRLSGTPLMTVGIAMGNQTNDNEGPTHAFFFPSPPGADIGPCVNTVDDGNGEGSIKIKIGATTKYLKYWADPAA